MSKKKKKKAKTQELFYETIGESISPGTAYLQAASLLDMAAMMAVEYADPEAMGAVAHQWMEMAVLMQGDKSSEEEEPEESFTETKVIGFGTKEMREVAEHDAREANAKNAKRIPR